MLVFLIFRSKISTKWQTRKNCFKFALAFALGVFVVDADSAAAQVLPQSPQKKAERLMDEGHWLKAAKIYQDLALQNPQTEGEYLAKAGHAFHLSGDLITSLHILEQSLKLLPNRVATVIEVAEIQKERGDFQAALAILMSYSQLHPDNMELRALTVRTISQHFQNQVDIAHSRIQQNPQDIEAYALMGRTLVLAGENGAALGILTEGVIENPKSVDLWIQIGALEVGAGRDNEAISAYGEAIRLENNNGLARNNLAFLLVTTKNPSLRDPILALIHAQQALEFEPENPAFLDTLAEIFNETGHHHRAVRTIKKAIDIAPNEPLYRRQLVRFQKAFNQSERQEPTFPAQVDNK